MPQLVSVFAENKPGKISRVTEVLEDLDVNILAITISDAGDYGIIKLLLNDPIKACTALQAKNIAASLKEIIAVTIEDSPGGLHAIAHILAENGLNVQDACGFKAHSNEQAVFIFQVEDVGRAESVLKKNGFTLLSESELTTF